MRAAPAGLTGLHDPFGLGTMAAAVTHGHPTGYLTAGFLSKTIAGLLAGHELDRALDDATAELREHPGHEETLAAVRRARAHDGGVEALGAGWIAEEALAIAIHCVLRAGPALRVAARRQPLRRLGLDGRDRRQPRRRAVRRGGDPAGVARALELREVIEQVADDFHEAYHAAGVGGEYEEIDDRLGAFLARYPGY